MYVTQQHPNSRFVTVRRATNFMERAQGKDAVDYFGEAKVSVGSYWESKNSTKVATGITFKEQDLLMPYLINMESDERGFRLAVEQFFHDIDTKVPSDTGTKLQIGLEEDNDKPVSKANLPISISDFIKWRHMLNHPKVAMNKEESEGNSLKEFYIHDPESVQKKKLNKSKEEDSAIQKYLAIKAEPLKVDMLLLLLGTDPRTLEKDAGVHSDRLKEYAVKTPEQFITMAGQDNFETRYLIEFLVKTEVLRKLGAKYQDAETKVIVGHDLEEAISFFTDPNNDQEVISYKARLQEAAKKPLIPTVRQTVLK